MNIYIDQPIKMALIATYPEMSKIFLYMTEKKGNIIAFDEYASFEDAVQVARRIENDVDVILSRGGTAEFIRRNVRIPVVFIPITPFDVVQAMRKLPADAKEVALSHFSSRIFGVDDISKMYSVKIHEYTFTTLDDIAKNVLDAKQKGIKVIIGGEVAVRIAQENGLSGIDLSAGNDTVNRAVEEAVSIVQAARQEKDRATRLTAALNSITEGLVVTDENNRLLVRNPAAAKILGGNNAIGEPFKDPFGMDLNKKLSRTPQFNVMRKIGDTLVNTNMLPVLLDGRFIGLVRTFEDVTKIQQLEQDIRNQLHDKGFLAKYTFADILTGDHRVDLVKKSAELYAQTDSAILIEGESGTGKELFAQSIHNASRRSSGPFVAINCAAIPENLLESELFGYEAGAFTGARKDGKRGLFEMAHRGTMFLDEIGELPKAPQARLLRVLQEKELMRVGGAKVIPVDTRIISATNTNLKELANSKDFREDLFYRLNVFNIRIPPLRERTGDVERLCRLFLNQLNVSIDEKRFKEYLPLLLAYDWPGNIRELQSVAERLSFLLTYPAVTEANDILNVLGLRTRDNVGGITVTVDVQNGLKRAIETVERDIIDHLLCAYKQNQNEVAKILGIGRTTLWRKYTQAETESE